MAESEAVLVRSGATALVCEEGHRDIVDELRDRTALTRFLLVDDDPEAPTGSRRCLTRLCPTPC